MKEYERSYPYFSLCGLSCGLCPRFHTDGESRCPGCGGPDFHLKHPSCKVINCSKNHRDIEFCSDCTEYPCSKYKETSAVDSFISYQNVLSDFEKLKNDGLEKLKDVINQKMEILEYLLENYNDGRKKNFYCLSVTVLQLPDLNDVLNQMKKMEQELNSKTEKEKIKQLEFLLKQKAEESGKILELRK